MELNPGRHTKLFVAQVYSQNKNAGRQEPGMIIDLNKKL